MSVILQALTDDARYRGDTFRYVLDYLGHKTTSGERVSPDKALGLAAYYACGRNIAEDIGKLPVSIARVVSNGTRVELDTHVVYRLLRVSPCDEMTPMTFKELLTGWAVWRGNGYAEIVRDASGRPAALYPIHPQDVTVKRRNNADRDVYYAVIEDGKEIAIEQRDMFHLKGMGGDGLVGYSPASIARESIGSALATQKQGAAFFGNGMHLGGILEHPMTLTPEAKTNLRESMDERFKGAGRAYRTMVLEEGMKWHQTTVPPEDAQFLETRQFQVEEICRWFRMPPHKIQQLLRSTFSNIEHQGIEYVQDTLMPWMTRWEEEIKRKLLMRERVQARFVVRELLRGDARSRGEYYRTMFNLGAMSRNEIRREEEMNPVEDGDGYYLQLNMAPVATIDAEETGQPSRSDSDGGDAGNASTESAMDIRPILAAAVQRCNDKERKAVTRAIKRADAGRIDLAEWYGTFSDEQLDYYIESIRPILSAISLNGSTEAQIRRYLLDHFAARAVAVGSEIDDDQVACDLQALIEEAYRASD